MPGDTRAADVDAMFAEAAALHEAARRDGFGPLLAVADAIAAAFAAGRKVLVFGNGGSAADAQHFAAELAVRFERERQALPALALTTDTSVLTAVGNDFGFAQVFARQIEALGGSGDVAIGITTSGASSNVRTALEAARTRGLVTVALTGNDGGVAGSMADLHLNVPHASTARVQEVQRTQIHAICWLVERGLAQENGRARRTPHAAREIRG